MQPGFARRTVVSAVNAFIEHMRVVASEAEDLLFQPCGGLGHQILITLTPQFVSMKKCAGNAGARGFDNMLGHGTGIERGQLAMPEYDFAAIAGSCGHCAIHALSPLCLNLSVRTVVGCEHGHIGGCRRTLPFVGTYPSVEVGSDEEPSDGNRRDRCGTIRGPLVSNRGGLVDAQNPLRNQELVI
jgi:hypothetical protein